MTTHGLTIKERIQAHIISRDGCWITNYRTDSDGRPQITINRKSFTLARVVYELYKKDSPKNLIVSHRCDNLLCINPDHLYIKTSAKNGRNRKRRNQQAKGSRIGNAKLNESQVIEIRDALIEGKLTFKEIGDIFGVSHQTVRLINNGKTWTQVEGIGLKNEIKKTVGTKLDETQIIKIRDALIEGKLTFKQIGDIFGVSYQTIRLINKGKIWTHVEGIGSKIKRR